MIGLRGVVSVNGRSGKCIRYVSQHAADGGLVYLYVPPHPPFPVETHSKHNLCVSQNIKVCPPLRRHLNAEREKHTTYIVVTKIGVTCPGKGVEA